MRFGDTLKKLREEHGFTQRGLSAKLKITQQSIQNYETGKRFPKKGTLDKIAVFFAVPLSSLLSDEDQYILDAAEKGGSKVRRDMEAFMKQADALFAGGELSQEDMDKVMQVMNEMYWKAKANNQKYTPKKYRQETEEP